MSKDVKNIETEDDVVQLYKDAESVLAKANRAVFCYYAPLVDTALNLGDLSGAAKCLEKAPDCVAKVALAFRIHKRTR